MTAADDDTGLDAGAAIDLPPLLTACPLDAGTDPTEAACRAAAKGCDAGAVFYTPTPDRVRAAVVLAPETPLEQAMAALPACAVAVQNALGALCPPEMAVHLDWAGPVMVNGAECGRVLARASTGDPGAVPDWLVVGIEIALLPDDPDSPGSTPDRTALYLEGGGEMSPRLFLESWARHFLVRITRLDDADGRAHLHREWTALAWRLDEAVTPQAGDTGTFIGLDENFGMLLRGDPGPTRLVPLTRVLTKGK